MRHQQRQRMRLEKLTDDQNKLQRSNQSLRNENDSLRSMIRAMKETNRKTKASRNTTYNTTTPSTTGLPAAAAPNLSEQQLINSVAPILQVLLNAEQRPGHLNYIGRSHLPQLQAPHLPSIKSSLLESTLLQLNSTMPLSSGVISNPVVVNPALPDADVLALRSSLELLQSYSYWQHQYGSQLGVQSRLPQAQQLNMLGAIGQPISGVAVSLSESGNENPEDSVDEEPSSEKS